MSSFQTRQIPILDLQPEIDALLPQISEAVERVIQSTQFILGPETLAFEEEVAEWLGAKFAVGVNSGTDALVIGLRAAGIGTGDEVITAPFSFFASAESISNVGARPVFVDVELDSMNIDTTLIEAAITEKTRAIVPVHLFGNPCDMDKVMALADKYDLKVIEDCAQSFGSQVSGKYTGTIGHVGAFSFFPTKNLGCYGDGGLIATDDDKIAEQCRKLRSHGSLKKYQNEILGYNSRLDAIQAAILRIKLPYVATYNENRNRIAAAYWEGFKGVHGIAPPQVVAGHVFHQYTVRVLSGKRNEVQRKLQDMGIQTMIYYPTPQDRLPVYAGQFPEFPKSDILAAEVLSLPIWPQMDDETQAYVIECVKSALK